MSAILGFGYIYYDYWGKFSADEEKYPHYIGYIDQDAAVLNDKYELCGEKSISYVYNGASYRAYAINKGHFREHILKNYANQDYQESGYVNLRFLVNCEGNPGWFEIIQMDLNLREVKLNEKMVNQLLELTADSGNWNVLYRDKEPLNYYMYISYRIENGAITEILP